jgi:hypothetical protein
MWGVVRRFSEQARQLMFGKGTLERVRQGCELWRMDSVSEI